MGEKIQLPLRRYDKLFLLRFKELIKSQRGDANFMRI